MKKFLSTLLAAAAALTMSAQVFAEAGDPATITFDTEAYAPFIHTFGNAEDTNLTIEMTDKGVSGSAILLKEDFSEAITNPYGGIYIDAKDFGLDTFEGYTVSMMVKPAKGISEVTDRLSLFTDGEEWSTVTADASLTDEWTKYSILVAQKTANSKVGISIPITDPYSGDVAYIDDIVVTDKYGNNIANIGDIAEKTLAQAPNTFLSVLTTILFILLILAAIAGAAYFIIKVVRSYR